MFSFASQGARNRVPRSKNTNACPSTTTKTNHLSTFSYDLFSELSRSSDANVLVSPFSVASAMAMVLAGATPKSTCESELKNVLGVDSHDVVAESTKEIVSSSSESVSLTSANGLWSRSAVRPSFAETVREIHSAVAAELPDTYVPIDEYVSEKTNGLLQNTMEGGPVDPLTVAVLVNAVHFKGDWTVEFEKESTATGTFTNHDGGTERVPFMRSERETNFASGVEALGGADVVRLDYGTKDDADVAALFVLPAEKGREALDDVVERLSTLNAEDDCGTKRKSFSETALGRTFSKSKLRLYLPRFRISYGTRSLKAELRSLGVNSCFDDDESLLEMSDDPKVRLDEVVHKTVMEVTEEGTEAAAATVAVIKSRSLPRPSPTIKFNRPFVMLVMHLPTNTPLFLAKVDDPEFEF